MGTSIIAPGIGDLASFKSFSAQSPPNFFNFISSLHSLKNEVSIYNFFSKYDQI